MSKSGKAPAVLSDARFGAARTLVTTSHADQAVDAFAVLLEHSIARYGPDHVESSILYYEYGNAIFRAHQRSSQEEPRGDGNGEASDGASKIESDGPSPPSGREQEGSATAMIPSSAVDRRKALAEAAERRLSRPKDPHTGSDGKDDVLPSSDTVGAPSSDDSRLSDSELAKEESPGAKDEGDEKEDVLLALEMMETCWSILDQYTSSSTTSSSSVLEYLDWATDQLPRVLTGLGDVLSCLGRHADAADAYLRALGLRQAALQNRFDAARLEGWLSGSSSSGAGSALSSDQRGQLVDWLVCRRRIVEASVLIAEELLAHVEAEGGADRDVVTTETKAVLVPAKERVEYASGYYESSREQLQEAVLLLGQLKAKFPSHEPLEEEKENVCFAATLVMGVGEALAALDEEGPRATAQEPVAKRLKS